jgi:hypothetical protein
MPVFVAPIFVAVEAADATEAADALSHTLRELMIRDDLLDWGYAKAGGDYARPCEVALTVDEAASEEKCLEHAYAEAAPKGERPFIVCFFVDTDKAVETFSERVMASDSTEAWDKAIEQAKASGTSRTGHGVRDDEWENATEIDTVDVLKAATAR